MTQWRILVPIGIAAALWLLGILRLDVPGDFGQAGATSQPCRPTAAEAAMTEIAGGPPGVPTPTAVPYPVVTSELVVLAGDRDVPRLLPSLVIRAPVDDNTDLNSFLDKSPAELRDGTPQGEADDPAAAFTNLAERNPYRGLLSDLLTNDPARGDDFGLITGALSGDAQELLQDILDIREAPIVGVANNGTVTLVLPAGEEPLADSNAAFAGGWVVSSSGRAVTFRFDEDIHPTAALAVGVCTDGLPVVAANLTTPTPAASVLTPLPTPLPTPAAPLVSPATAPSSPDPESQVLLIFPSPVPTATPSATPTAVPDSPLLLSQNSTGVNWFFPRTSNPSDITGVQVETRVPFLATFRMKLFTEPLKVFATAVAYALPAALVLAGLWFVARAGATGSEFTAAKGRLTTITWAFIRLILAAVLSVFVTTSYKRGWNVKALALWRDSSLATWFQEHLPALNPEHWLTTGFPSLLLGVVAAAVVGLGLLGIPRQKGTVAVASPWEPALGLTAALAIAQSFAYVARSDAFESEKYWMIQPALLVAAYTMFLVMAMREWWHRADVTYQPRLRLLLPAVGAVSLLLCLLRFEMAKTPAWNRLIVEGILPLWVTCCLVIGFVLVAAVLVHAERQVSVDPAERAVAGHAAAVAANSHPLRAWVRRFVTRIKRLFRQGPDQEGSRRDRGGPVLGTGAIARGFYVVVFIFALLMQWEWANFDRQTIWWRAPVEVDPVRYLPEVSNARLFVDQVSYVPTFLDAAFDLLLVLVLASYVGVLRGAAEENRTPFWDDDQRWIRKILGVLFAALVIGYGGQMLGFRAPAAFLFGLFLLPLALSCDVADDSCRIDADPANTAARKRLDRGDPTRDGTPLILAYRANLLRRALERAGVKPAPVIHDYTPPLVVDPCAPGTLALGLGPAAQWWQNGIVAVRLGVWLAVLPITYFLFVFLGTPGTGGWSIYTPFALAGLFSALAFEIAFWLVAAFALGCLFPYLRGQNGLVKGIALGSVYVAANAAAAVLGIPGNALWQVRSFQLLLFLMVLGAWLDLRTLEAEGYGRRELMALYELPKTTSMVKQLLPLAVALAGVIAQLYSQQTLEATQNLISGEASGAILNALANLHTPGS